MLGIYEYFILSEQLYIIKVETPSKINNFLKKSFLAYFNQNFIQNSNLKTRMKNLF